MVKKRKIFICGEVWSEPEGEVKLSQLVLNLAKGWFAKARLIVEGLCFMEWGK
jgi:hypothetical protein